MSASRLLEHLEHVRQTAPGRWLANCPAHQDRSPSLSICERDDGLVLIWCFAGCGALDVLNSIGLKWSALFPPRMDGNGSYPSSRPRIPAADLLVMVDHEIVTAALLVDGFLTRPATEAERQRLHQCAANIGRARDIAAPMRVKRNDA